VGVWDNRRSDRQHGVKRGGLLRSTMSTSVKTLPEKGIAIYPGFNRALGSKGMGVRTMTAGKQNWNNGKILKTFMIPASEKEKLLRREKRLGPYRCGKAEKCLRLCEPVM